MAKLRELIPNYGDLLAQGVSENELMNLAKLRSSQAQNDSVLSLQEDASMLGKLKDVSRDTLQSDGTVAQIAKGFANNFIGGAKVLNGLSKTVQDKLGVENPEGIKIPRYDQLVQLGEKLDQKKENLSQKFVSPDRKDEIDSLQQESKDAKGIVSNMKVGVKQMYDSATHPKEWTTQGITEFATDPLNAVSLGSGRVVSKVVGSPLLKFLVGSGAGAGENAIVSAGTEYARARGEGKSEEEAKNIAIQAASGGALVGAALGGAGGLSAKDKGSTSSLSKKAENTPSIDNALSSLGEDTTTSPASADSLTTLNEKTIIDPNKGSNYTPDWQYGSAEFPPAVSPFLNIIEAEIKAQDDHNAIIKASDEMVKSGVTDPQIIASAIDQQIKPSETDFKITHIINDGQELPPSYSGARLAVKIDNTIASGIQTPDEVFQKLKSIGASDELAQRAAQAVEAKNPDLFYAWYTKKLESLYTPSKESITDTPVLHADEPSFQDQASQQTLPDQGGQDGSTSKTAEFTLNESLLEQFKNEAMPLTPKADVLSLVKEFSTPIKTPIFESKISIDKLLNHLAEKEDFDRRIEYINLIKPTLETPLFITKEGDRFRFFKTFVDDRDKMVKFLTVVEDAKGDFIGVTATPLKNTDVRNLMKGEVVWGGDTLSAKSTPQRLITKGGSLDEIIPQKATKTESEPFRVNALDDLESDIGYKEAYAAHQGTSFDPEIRAQSRINGYVDMLKQDFEALRPLATDEQKLKVLNARFGDYREKMKGLYRDLLAKESRVLSSMITGGARFPVEANRKKMGYADNARTKFLEFQEKALQKMRNELDPHDTSIKSNDMDAIAKLQSKLDAQTKAHEMMKQANVIMRSKDGVVEKSSKLKALGFSDKAIAQIGKDGGFESFALANSTQRINQTKGRITELKRLEEKEKEGKASTLLYDGAKVDENIPTKRAQIFFDEIPSESVRSDLKKRGFRWSKTEGAWQRILTPDAMRAAKEIIDRHYAKAFDDVTKKMLEC